MEEQLKKALDFSNYRQTFAIQRKVLHEKNEAKLTYGVNGGIFKIDKSLITFVHMLITLGRVKDIPLLDINDTPVLINDLESFRDEILDRYFTSTLEYFEEYQKLKKSRTVEKLVDV